MTVELNDSKVIFSFDRDAVPALTIDSGQTVRIRTKDCFSGQVSTPEDTLEALDWNAINPATGPIFVKGAVAGGALKVEIKAIELEGVGVCATGKDEGLYGDRLERWSTHLCQVSDTDVLWNDRLRLPLRPMVGVIGVAPSADPVNCGTPGPHGGNMDCNKITTGATVYFPVDVDGALFACGDMHAAMGNGEVGVSGVEIGGWLTVTLTAVPSLSIPTPLMENADELGVICSAPTLDEAADDAVHMLIDLVSEQTGADPAELAMLFSAAANLEICQSVDPLRTARLMVPKEVLAAYGFEL